MNVVTRWLWYLKFPFQGLKSCIKTLFFSALEALKCWRAKSSIVFLMFHVPPCPPRSLFCKFTTAAATERQQNHLRQLRVSALQGETIDRPHIYRLLLLSNKRRRHTFGSELLIIKHKAESEIQTAAVPHPINKVNLSLSDLNLLSAS